MHRFRIISIASLVLITLPVAVQAQTAQVDRMGGSGVFQGNLELSIGAWHERGSVLREDVTSLRTDFFISGGSEEGGAYLQAALSTLFADTISTDQISNIEIGGYGNIEIGPFTMVGRLGLVLPVIDPDLNGIAAIYAASRARPNDLALFIPDTLTIRPSLSILAEFGMVHVRGDLGFDVGISTNDEVNSGERLTYVRLNLSLGLNLGMAEVLLEFSNIGAIDDAGGVTFASAADRFQHSLGLLVALELPMIRPYLGVVLPLDEVGDATFFTLGVNVGY
jgi:hypothetical protein